MNTIATALMPSALCALELGAHSREIGLALHRAVGAHALVDLDDTLVEHLRLDDVAGEDLRPRLVADLQRVAEASGDRAAAVRSPLRSSSALVATVVPIFTAPTRPAGIASPGFRPSRSRMPCTAASRIGFGIFRQQLVRDQRAVRAAPDDVGEGAAAVDPEVPKLR